MTITSAKLENFTVFENVQCDFSPGINIFIGENGTGKTHLLKALYAFANGTSLSDGYFFSKLRSYFNGVMGRDLVRNRAKDTVAIFHFDTTTHGDFGYSIETPHDDTEIMSDNDREKEPFPAVMIPAKDMLTHSRALLTMAKKYSKDMPFDETLLEIIEKAESWKLDNIQEPAKSIMPLLEKVIGGKVIQENGDFFIQQANGDKLRFSHEAEGVKKLGLLWQLLSNGSINLDTLLLWDEPENSISPKFMPVLVDALIALQKAGMQIFLSTHDYLFAKYFEVRRTEGDLIRFHSLYKSDSGIKYEYNENFRDLKENPIISAYDELLDEVIRLNLGD